jgi:hypothetical protein
MPNSWQGFLDLLSRLESIRRTAGRFSRLVDWREGCLWFFGLVFFRAMTLGTER